MDNEVIKIYITKVGSREFLNFGCSALPIDRIKEFDFNAANGGASHGKSVRIVTDDPNDDFIFAYDNCEAIRKWLKKNRI